MNPKHDEMEIDLRELFYVLKSKLAIIIAVTAIFGIAMAALTTYVIKPKYSSTSIIYVMSKEKNELSISDLNLGSGLTADYIELIESRPVLEKVITNLDLDMKYEDLLKMVTITNPTDTRILNITVTYTDAYQAEKIANDIVKVAQKTISSIMNTEKPSVVQSAVSSGEKVSPNNVKNVLIAVVLGLFLSSGVIILIHVLDDTVKTPEDVERYLGLNTLAMIPDDKNKVDGANKKFKKKSIYRRREV
ncbi:MAG: Wzz/FepE/Etk N-terminal domain-containing protein [bacterium]|nr:Wzz/FepE/Etk N-terminal domain-containing protein [bacterium]